MRQLIRFPRLVLTVACALLAAAGAMIAAERSSSDMADAVTAFLASLTPEQRSEGRLPLRVRGADALELHPHRGLSAQWSYRQGDDRGAARLRAQPANVTAALLLPASDGIVSRQNKPLEAVRPARALQQDQIPHCKIVAQEKVELVRRIESHEAIVRGMGTNHEHRL